MTSFQKIIKYFALALAMYLIVNIILGIIFGINLITNIKSIDDNKIDASPDLKTISKESYHSLEIDLASTNLIIENGPNFEIKTNNQKINLKNKYNKLILEEKTHYLFKNKSYDLIITIPNDVILNDFEADFGAGSINIDNLNTNELSLDFGAGKLNIDKLNVNTKADINLGAGEVIINDAIINNLSLEGGVGDFTLNAILKGNNQVSAGIGKINLKLEDSIDNYKIKTEKGIGNIKINQEDIRNNTINGNGNNLIELEGGIGSIEIITR